MPTLSQLNVSWTGSAVVGGGVSVFYCSLGDENTSVTALRAFFNALVALIPSSVQITFPTSGNTLDEATGEVNGSYTAGSVAAVVCTGSGQHANGVGMRVKWPTIGIVGGRRVTGSTFIVPLLITQYEGAGNIISTALTTVATAGATLAGTANGCRIYSRPAPGRAGSSYPMSACSVPDKVSWLVSRRT